MSEYIYDLPLQEWALKFAYQTDIENELDCHNISMNVCRKQLPVKGKIVSYNISTSQLSRRYLTLHVELVIDKQKYMTQLRLYSPFVPQKLKALDDLLSCTIESIFPLCTIRHRRYDGPVIVASSVRVKTKDGIAILRTSDEITESSIVKNSRFSGGKLTKTQESLPILNEYDLIENWFKHEDTTDWILDPSVVKK